MTDIAAKVLVDFHERTGRPPALRSQAEHGRYASRVRIVSTPEQPTSFAGTTGVVARIEDEGNVFVRLHAGVIPFGASSLEAIS